MEYYRIFFLLLLLSCSKTNQVVSNGEFIEKGKLVNGKREGLWRKLNQENQLISEINYVNGFKNGVAKSWHTNGALYIEANYKNDTLVGEFIMYYTNKRKNYIQYRNEKGKDDGPFSLWYENGVLSQEGKYKEGKMIGKWLKYYKNGNLEDVKIYDSIGRKIDKWIYFNEQQDTIKVEEYIDNELINVTSF